MTQSFLLSIHPEAAWVGLTEEQAKEKSEANWSIRFCCKWSCFSGEGAGFVLLSLLLMQN